MKKKRFFLIAIIFLPMLAFISSNAMASEQDISCSLKNAYFHCQSSYNNEALTEVDYLPIKQNPQHFDEVSCHYGNDMVNYDRCKPTKNSLAFWQKDGGYGYVCQLKNSADCMFRPEADMSTAARKNK